MTQVAALFLLQQENKVEAARRVAWSIMSDFKVKNAFKTGPTVKNVGTPDVALYKPCIAWRHPVVKPHLEWRPYGWTTLVLSMCNMCRAYPGWAADCR